MCEAAGTAVGTVQIDNERTRVTEWRFAPGADTGVHIHEYDYVVVPGQDGKLRIVDADGSESIAEMKAGVSYFRNKGVHHNVFNANDFEYSFVEVEFK